MRNGQTDEDRALTRVALMRLGSLVAMVVGLVCLVAVVLAASTADAAESRFDHDVQRLDYRYTSVDAALAGFIGSGVCANALTCRVVRPYTWCDPAHTWAMGYVLRQSPYGGSELLPWQVAADGVYPRTGGTGLGAKRCAG